MKHLAVLLILVAALVASGCQRVPGAGTASMSASASAEASQSTAPSPSASSSPSAGGINY